MGIDFQPITVIASILFPTLSGFVWIIHRMDKQFKKVEARFEKIKNRISSMENKLTAIDMRTSFIERLLEMFRPLQFSQKEITDP